MKSLRILTFAAVICICHPSIVIAIQDRSSEVDTVQDSLDVIALNDSIIVTSSRSTKQFWNIPAAVDLATSEHIRHTQLSRSLPVALSGISGVTVQKTAHAQGSPYMRGFTGFRTLFLIDGIRLNNSVFRDGPNQYWATVDPLSMRKLDVIKGQGSIFYGTDAIGGVVNALPQVPPPSASGDTGIRSRLHYRYATAEQSNIGRMDVGGNLGEEFSFVAGLSGKDFGTVDAGSNVGAQPKTGYKEVGGDFYGICRIRPNIRLIAGAQRSKLDDVWRTHRTIYGVTWKGTNVGSDRKYVYSQERTLAYARFLGLGTGIFDRLSVTVSYHDQQEDQHRVRSGGESTFQGFNVGTVGLQLESDVSLSFGDLTAGMDFYRDAVSSYRSDYDSAGLLDAVRIQGPVGDDAYYVLTDLFASFSRAVSDQLVLTLGGRLSRSVVHARQVENPNSGSVMSVKDDWSTLIGSASALWRLRPGITVYSSLAQSYRAPNLSDLTRFDAARSNEVEVPTQGLDPERFLSAELGVKYQTGVLSGTVAAYYTAIRDLIVRTPTGNQLNGDNLVTKKNSGDGFARGVEFSTQVKLFPTLLLSSWGAWMYGEVDTYPTSHAEFVREPLDRLMPPSGGFGVQWSPSAINGWEVSTEVRSAAAQPTLSTRDQADTQRIPPGGTPGYVVTDIRISGPLGWKTALAVRVDNIFDTDYRIHGSGQNEPGRNFVIGVNWSQW